jgi:hypothetical protein
MRALDGLLKELPLHGLSWPQVSSATVAVTWSSGTPSVVSFPTDYFGVPVLKYTDASGNLVELQQLAKPAYDALQTAQTGTYPESFHVGASNAVYLWPVPTQDPVLRLTYQAIVADASTAATPGVQQACLNALMHWLADEISPIFAPAAKRPELAARAALKRGLMLQWSAEVSPIYITVDE